MAYWLVKEEPHKYNFSKLLADGETVWDGVRNYAARNHLRAMKLGDELIYYHTGKERSAVGTAVVAKVGYPDPTATEGDWTAVDVTPGIEFATPVSLAEIKAEPKMQDCMLVTHGRLSVIPLTAAEFRWICKQGKA